jgi:2-dehydropantoate 2-reductase
MNLDRSDAFNHICIAGLGGVGGYFGGIIAFNITSNYRDKRDVTFIARGSNLDAIKKNGLTLKLLECEPINCIPNVATDKVTDLALINLLIIAVKRYDLQPLVESLKEKISSDTVIIPLMNGVGNEEIIRNIIPNGIILPGCVYISSMLESPGVIKLQSNICKIVAGPDSQNPEYNSSEIESFFRNIGIKFIWDSNPQIAIWKKYLFIAPAALITGANNITINGIVNNKELENDFCAIMGEIRQIADKKGIILPDNAEEDSLKIAFNIDKDAKTSFQLDLEKGKKNTEIDALGYSIVKMGKEYGVQTPVTEKTLSKIKL